MEQVGELGEEEDGGGGDGEEEGGLTVVAVSGRMEAAGQIDLSDADPTVPEEHAVAKEPQQKRKEPVNGAARLLLIVRH